MSDREPVLIAGGGIGGLALALALARQGWPSIVLERQQKMAGAGAGIQIGPNGVRALQRLDLAEALRPVVGEPEAIIVHAGASGRVLSRLPLGAWIARRHEAPYWVVHRGDLHRALLEAVRANSRIEVRPGFELASLAQDARQVTATDRAGTAASGSVLIGADGIWSTVRQSLPDMPTPQFAGATATRTVIPAEDAGRLAVPAVGLWLNPNAHVVHYPVRGGADIAVVVIARENWQAREWDAAADRATLLGQLSAFHPSLTEVLHRVPSWSKWALYTLAPLPRWTAGRVALLGDAAHPMLPYLAQGGAFAIEDALTLAHCLGANGSVPAALTAYASLRRARADRAQAASVRQGNIYRLSRPLAWFRDAVLRLTPGTLLMRRLDWLYDWTPR